MKNQRTLLTVICFLFFTTNLSIAQLPDPKQILLKAQSVLQNVQSVTYRAERYVIGTLKYGDKDAILMPYQGDVLLARSIDDKYFGGRFIIECERLKTKPEASGSSFTVVYDGQKIRKLIPQEKIVYVNDPDQTGQQLLIGAYDLILNDLLNKEPLKDVLKADETEYDGVAVVSGVPCHIIHTSFSGGSFPKESWWFFGMDDCFPRKVQHVGFGLPEQQITTVFTLNDLKTNINIDPSSFSIDAPEGYSVKIFQGFGKSAPALSPGEAAPDWILQDPKGNSFSLADFQGKIVVLDFWATWCGPCRKAMGYLQKLHESYGNKGVIIVGINMWESGDPVQFMQEKGYTYRLLLKGDETAEKYRVNGIPTLYMIGPDGKILYGEVGSTPETYSKLEQLIKEHLTKK